jgi:hypothetical protein
MPYKKMARDGAYSDSPYGNRIDGYRACTDEGRSEKNSGKARFLRDAASMLRQVGQILKEKGLDQCEIKSNAAGPACSGEVYAEYWPNSQPLLRVWVEIGTVPLSMLSGREDSVCIMARTQRYGMEGKRAIRGISGENQWLSPGYDSRELAEQLLDIYNKKYLEVRICTRQAEPIVLPSPFVRNPQEEQVLLEAYRRANAAIEEDAGQPEPMTVPEGQIELL